MKDIKLQNGAVLFSMRIINTICTSLALELIGKMGVSFGGQWDGGILWTDGSGLVHLFSPLKYNVQVQNKNNRNIWHFKLLRLKYEFTQKSYFFHWPNRLSIVLFFWKGVVFDTCTIPWQNREIIFIHFIIFIFFWKISLFDCFYIYISFSYNFIWNLKKKKSIGQNYKIYGENKKT